MNVKNRFPRAARLLRIAALTAALLLLFSSCGMLRPADDGKRTETSAPAETDAVTETERQTDTGEEATTAAPEDTSAAESETPEASTAPPPADRTGEEIYEAHGELTPVNYDSPALLPLTADAGQGYIDNITFLCDSPFYALKVFEMLSGGYGTTQIWTGPEGTMTLGYLDGFEILDPFDDTLRTIPEALALHKPPVLMITLGINGVALWDEAEFREAYVWLINMIREASPDTVILTQSILPISPDYVNWGMFTNALITEANSWILEISEQYGLHYLDTYSALAGEDGNIRPEFVQIDGLHIRPEGLEAALSYIRTHAYLPLIGETYG